MRHSIREIETHLFLILKIVQCPAEGFSSGIGAVILFGDLLGLFNNIAGRVEGFFPCLGI